MTGDRDTRCRICTREPPSKIVSNINQSLQLFSTPPPPPAEPHPGQSLQNKQHIPLSWKKKESPPAWPQEVPAAHGVAALALLSGWGGGVSYPVGGTPCRDLGTPSPQKGARTRDWGTLPEGTWDQRLTHTHTKYLDNWWVTDPQHQCSLPMLILHISRGLHREQESHYFYKSSFSSHMQGEGSIHENMIHAHPFIIHQMFDSL